MVVPQTFASLSRAQNVIVNRYLYEVRPRQIDNASVQAEVGSKAKSAANRGGRSQEALHQARVIHFT